VRKHVAIALGALALTAGIAASGCSGGSDADAESPVADAESSVDITEFRAELEQRFAVPPNEVLPSWARHIRVVNIAEFRAAFKERFGVPPNEVSPSWYRHITGIRMGANRLLVIKTDLGAGQTETALAICGAGTKVALDDLGALGDGIEGVLVRRSDGVGLFFCA